ncbi:MAG TPA: hypothetical protein VIF62_30390, partial [Labilithrix sp.]
MVPAIDEAAIAPLRRALEDAGVVSFDGRGAAAARITGVAFDILEAAERVDRRLVARVLASGYIDPTRVVHEPFGTASALVAAFTRKLESAFTAAGPDEVERFVRTAGEGRERDVARALADTLLASRNATTRRERVRAARQLWDALGIGSRAGRGALRAFGSDAAAAGIAGAERAAVVADARAWEAVVSALGRYESWAELIGVADARVDAKAFRCELRELVDRATVAPAGDRIAAVRIGRAEDLAGEALDRLIILDANASLFPLREAGEALVSEALCRAVAPDVAAATSSDAVQLAAIATSAASSARVALLFSSEDDAGAPLAPSPIVDALVRFGVPVRVAPPPSLPPVSEG